MVVLTNDEDQDYILIEERKCTSLPSSPAKRVSQPKRKQFFINQAIRNSDLIPRAKGKKSLRRQENARHLANLLERDECSKDDLEVCSNPAIPTIFSQACTNGDYIEPWNDFMNCTGEEQERLLSLLEKEDASKKNTNRLHKDHENVNDAFTDQDCFQRIDRRLRATLRRKQVPLGTLEMLEENLLSFFVAQPHSVYKTKLDSSFERLLLHAVCQYMDLVSASTFHDGSRLTEVVNKQEVFLPPRLLLSAYVERMSWNRDEFALIPSRKSQTHHLGCVPCTKGLSKRQTKSKMCHFPSFFNNEKIIGIIHQKLMIFHV